MLNLMEKKSNSKGRVNRIRIAGVGEEEGPM